MVLPEHIQPSDCVKAMKPVIWDQIPSKSMQAVRSQRDHDAVGLLRQVLGNDSRKVRQRVHYQQALSIFAFVLFNDGGIFIT